MGFIGVGLVGLAIYIINSQPTSTVVLLPDADGKTGSLIIKSEGRQQSVSTAYGSASVNRRGNIHTAGTDVTPPHWPHGPWHRFRSQCFSSLDQRWTSHPCFSRRLTGSRR